MNWVSRCGSGLRMRAATSTQPSSCHSPHRTAGKAVAVEYNKYRVVPPPPLQCSGCTCGLSSFLHGCGVHSGMVMHACMHDLLMTLVVG